MADIRGQISLFNDNPEYEAFTQKFEPKKTTDDCYTPLQVYEAVAGWVETEYGVKRDTFVRPFYPGGDYEREQYPSGCVVVDNPPFSILTQILRFYCKRGIRFFLFGPTLTLFAGRGLDVTYIPCDAPVTYENNAEVNTSFITNLDNCRVRTAPELYRRVKQANDMILKTQKKQLPRYEYPDAIITAAMVGRWSKYGVEYRLGKDECIQITALDSQRQAGKAIFGSGFFLSERAAAERAAAERAAAERAAAERWQLSERELRVMRSLGNTD